MSELFRAVKAAVSARAAAERYGLQVGRGGMVRCPFHPDGTPSMKVDDRFFCFGCGARGDSIDLAGRLLGLPPREAALRLAADFGVPVDEDAARPRPVSTWQPRAKEREDGSARAFRVLMTYRSLLRDWEKTYAPRTPDDVWHPRACEALEQLPFVEYLLDELLTTTKARQPEFEERFGKEIDHIEERLRRIERGREESPGGPPPC